MKTYPFYDSQPTFLDLNGKPLVGRVAIYDKDTAAYATVYLSGEEIAANPMRTDGSGHLEDQLFLEEDKTYRICVQEFLGKDPSSMDEYWLDPEMWRTLYDYTLLAKGKAQYAGTVVGSVAEVAGADSELGILTAKGFYKSGDCPSRTFVWTETAVFPEDGCTSIKAKDGGYWTWFPGPVVDSGCFGIMPSATTEEITAGLLSLQTHTASAGAIKTVCFRSGTYLVMQGIRTNVSLKFEPGAMILPQTDIAFECRSVFAQPGFIQKEAGESPHTVSVSVSEGDYILSWYGDGYSSVDAFGTPDRIICDKSMTTSVNNFTDCTFENPSGSYALKLQNSASSAYFTRCAFNGCRVLNLTSVGATFSNCPKVRTSVVCSAFKASYIKDSTSGTFIVDSTVSMDADIDQTVTVFYTADGALFDAQASEGTLVISAKSIRTGMLACNTTIPDANWILLDWFKSAAFFVNSVAKSNIYRMDFCGRNLLSSVGDGFGNNQDCYFRNGTFGIGGNTAFNTVYLDKCNLTLSFYGTKEYSFSLNASNSTLTVGSSASTGATLTLPTAELRNSEIKVYGELSSNMLTARDSRIEAKSITVVNAISGYDSYFSATEGALTASKLGLQGCRCYGMTGVNVVTAEISSSECLATASGTKLEFSSKSAGMETVFNSTASNSSIIRKNASFTGTARNDPYSTVSETTLQQFAPNISLNGGVYSSSGWDSFGLCPSIPCITPTAPAYCITLTLAQGSTRDLTIYPEGSDNSYVRTFYGVRGASRPKAGQMFFVLPTYNGGKGDLDKFGNAITCLNFVRSSGVNIAVAEGVGFKNTEGRVFNLDDEATGGSTTDTFLRPSVGGANTGTNTVVGFTRPLLVVCTGFETMVGSEGTTIAVPGFEIYGETKFVLTENTSGVFK